MMVEGTDGIIIIDAGETNEQAQQGLSEFHKITNKSVVAVIYTHNPPSLILSPNSFII
jgi:linear primary-alkylsulfatase